MVTTRGRYPLGETVLLGGGEVELGGLDTLISPEDVDAARQCVEITGRLPFLAGAN